ncbi:MAG TPA: radical SAM protein [Bacteroidales bacterium]|nr:radical SAM protein [Bacteroidales bacterium]
MKILSFRGSKALFVYCWRFLQTLTISRLLNHLKLQGSYFFSTLMKRPYHWGNPVAVSFEPTTACNLRCPECPSGTRILNRTPGNASLEDFKIILKQLPRETTWLTLYFQGEPFINKYFFEMIGLAKRRRMMVASSTNGHFLDAENAQKTIASGLDMLIISLDGTDAVTYQQYRKGGDFDLVLTGIKTLAKLKRQLKRNSPLVVLQFLVFKHNEHQINDMEKLGKELGADALELKTAQHYNYEDGNDFMTGLDKYSRYRKTGSGKYVLKRKMKNRCLRMWNACVITWDGSVVPCCYDKDANHCYGNLLHGNFRDVWNGKEADDFRQWLWQNRKAIEICSNCHE